MYGAVRSNQQKSNIERHQKSSQKKKTLRNKRKEKKKKNQNKQTNYKKKKKRKLYQHPYKTNPFSRIKSITKSTSTRVHKHIIRRRRQLY